MTLSCWGQGPTQFFYQLDAEAIFSALETLGLRPNGILMGLNSYENRVYEIGIEPTLMNLGMGVSGGEAVGEELPTQETLSQVVAKFYRPGRWSREQIQEEHDFLFDLRRVDVPVISPILIDGQSLHFHQTTGLFFTLYPRRGGRAPQDLTEQQAMRLGRLIGRSHLCGRSKLAHHRTRYTPQIVGAQALSNIQQGNLASEGHKKYLETVAMPILAQMEQRWPKSLFRIHGDLHPGNILERDGQWWILDLDDMVTGPAMQDFWMLLPPRSEALDLWNAFAEGYETFSIFPWEQMSLANDLRLLRQLHYAGWVSKRWDDPAFAQAFTHYQSPTIWQDLINSWQMANNTQEYL